MLHLYFIPVNKSKAEFSVFGVRRSFRNHSDMLTLCSRNMLKTFAVVLPYAFINIHSLASLHLGFLKHFY